MIIGLPPYFKSSGTTVLDELFSSHYNTPKNPIDTTKNESNQAGYYSAEFDGFGDLQVESMKEFLSLQNNTRADFLQFQHQDTENAISQKLKELKGFE